MAALRPVDELPQRRELVGFDSRPPRLAQLSILSIEPTRVPSHHRAGQIRRGTHPAIVRNEPRKGLQCVPTVAQGFCFGSGMMTGERCIQHAHDICRQREFREIVVFSNLASGVTKRHLTRLMRNGQSPIHPGAFIFDMYPQDVLRRERGSSLPRAVSLWSDAQAWATLSRAHRAYGNSDAVRAADMGRHSRHASNR
jgi:hypothetical protein